MKQQVSDQISNRAAKDRGFWFKRLLVGLVLLNTLMPALPSLACSIAQPESFEPFFTRFVRDDGFAMQRTQAFVQTVTWDHVPDISGNDSSRVPQETPVRAEKFFTDFSSPKALMNDAAIHSTVTVPAKNQRSVFFGVQNSDAVMLTYKFKLRNGCWYLWGFEDESL